MKPFHTLMMSSFLSIQLLFGNVQTFAEEKQQSVQENEKHVAAGSRALTIAEQLGIKEKLAAEPCEGSCEKDVATCEKGLLSILANGWNGSQQFQASIPFTSKKAAAAYYVTTHPGAIHWPAALGLFGEKVELEDGSIWTVSSSDGYKTLNWMVYDHLVITPNHEWFSVYSYRIHNQNTSVSVAANLTLFLNVPFHTSYNRRVIALDDVLKMIWLDDGSIWSISTYDYSLKWLVGDTVIIGINDGWLSSSRPNILINANLLHHVRANCLN